jgi:hypothetical protein
MNQRVLIAGVLIGVAVICAAWPYAAPSPAPLPESPLDLRGTFVGADAAVDAATTAALLGELADAIEFDGTKAEPRLRTGAAFDDLRTTARDLRCRGQTLGAKQPRVREAIKHYLEERVGTSGGPVDADGRATWVRAFREVAAAAEAAAR